ncbi:MAG: YigZ family protein [Mollicutes bacterium]|nr:YigZ family protein [Mollicutes bacterium]
MFSIKENVNNEIVINKSRFITELIKINNEDEIINILNNIKKKYPNATHYCYAYICGSKRKCSDDGEPRGTAGIPILNVLEKHNLNNILCVVIRYFGGIKLGANGLVRAYSKSVSSLIESIDIVELVEGYEITLKFDYNATKSIDYLLKEYKIIKKEYSATITYIFEISKKDYEIISNQIKDYEINKKNIIINKYE